MLKRFLSEDPIGLSGGSLSFYAYVNGDPVSYVDPEGMKSNPGARTGGGRWGSPYGPGGRNESGGKLPPIDPVSPNMRDLHRQFQNEGMPETACDYNPGLCVPKTTCVKWFCERKKNNDTPYQCRPPLDYSFEYP